MIEIKIKCDQFDFDRFFESMESFIKCNFGNSPADSMRYFDGMEWNLEDKKENEFPIDEDKSDVSDDDQLDDIQDWEMTDFKKAIVEYGWTLFFPFMVFIDTKGTIRCANGDVFKLESDYNDEDFEDDNPDIGLTDCFGFVVKIDYKNFIFNSAICWGDVESSIEDGSHSRLDSRMAEFVLSFKKKKAKGK
jgi:hypothetical protein